MTNAVMLGIGATVLKDKAIGETIEERFKAVIQGRNIANACWYTTSDEDCFRAAVGGLLLSYPEDSDERARITAEIEGLQRASALISALQSGLPVDFERMAQENEQRADVKPIGLLDMWHKRER